ncbi:MAG: cation-translocating P-type ATPase C-terminal domain-containing protein [Planctomycetota bacterium]
MSSNIGEVVAIFAAVLIGGPLVFLPAHLLWINLVTDGLTSLALGVEPAERDVMKRPPRVPTAPMLDRAGLLVTLVQGAFIGLATLALFHIWLARGSSVEHARSIAFSGIVVGELINAWNYRSLRGLLASVGLFSNRWFALAWIASFALQIAAIHLPFLQVAFHTEAPEIGEWATVFGVFLAVLLATELYKRRIRDLDRGTEPRM